MTSQPRIVHVSQLASSGVLSPLTIRVLVLCFFVCMIDNYDNTALAFAIPQLIQLWHIPKMMVGSIFSVGLFGLMIGSIAFGWVGDRFGRKTALLFCLFSFGALTLATTAVDSVRDLMVLRFLAGLGVGGALPNAIALTNEYSPARLRVTAIAMIFAGYTLGAAGGGFIAALFIPAYGWQAVFVFGGVVPIILGFVLIAALPESIRFLAGRPGRTREAAALARRMRPDLAISGDTRIVADQAVGARSSIIKDLFDGARLAMTPLLWVIYIANSMVVFALSNWLPTLMGSIGIAPSRAALVAALFAVGGSVGGLIASRAVDRFGLLVIVVCIACGVPAVMLLGQVTGYAALLFAVPLAGLFVAGTQNSLHGIAGSLYPTRIRANGVGWALGIAKIGSISGPFIAGSLLAYDVPLASLFLYAAIPLIVALVAAVALKPLYDAHIVRHVAMADEQVDPARDRILFTETNPR